MIDVSELKYSYPKSEQLAVNGISFSVAKGEIFGFLGPSGSGKSTTQKILCKLLGNYEGKASVEGKEIKAWDQSLYSKIGVGFELPNHYLKLTALENLHFFGSFYSKTLDASLLLEKVGLSAFGNTKVAEYSKGMKMRLNFVRAIMHNPEVLFLDEPTSGLDPVNGRIIKDLITELRNEGKTIFLTTHQMFDADELCDRVAFIVDGQIKKMDSPKNLKLQYSKRTVEVLIDGEPSSTFQLDNLGQNTSFLDLIKHNKVESIHSKEASLDEIFITVTGKSLKA